MEPDVTQSVNFYKAWAWFETHKKEVVYGFVALIIVGIIAGFIVYQRGQKRIEAEEALSRVFVPQATGAPAPEQAATGYLKVASDYPNSAAGARALLLGAASLYHSGKFAEAQKEFEKFAREHRESPFLGQAQLGIAASLEAQGKTNEAVAAYKLVVDRRGNENVGSQARFSLANLYAAQKKPELALPLYEEIAKNEPYGSLGSEAGMRAEEIKVQHPELAPAPEVQITPVSPVATPPTIILTNGRSGLSNAAIALPKLQSSLTNVTAVPTNAKPVSTN